MRYALLLAVGTLVLGGGGAFGLAQEIAPGPVTSQIKETSVEEVCLEFRARGRRLVEQKTCALKGRTSPWMWTGDDSGYQDQYLRLTAWGDGEVCLRYDAVGFARRSLDQGWVCSSHGIPSKELFLGDDTGYKKQTLTVRTNTSNSVCLEFSSRGRKGVRQSGMDCSSFGQPGRGVYLGDDSGYRNQELRISVGGR